MRNVLLLLALVASLGGCKSNAAPSAPADSAASTSAAAAPRARLARADFNRIALHLDLPVYWAADDNGNGAPDPGEVKALLFYPTAGNWVDNGAFTPDYERAASAISGAAAAVAPANLPAEESERRGLVLADLDQGAPTLVVSDFRTSPPAEKQLVQHMLAASTWIDQIVATMRGARALEARVPRDDPASLSLFRRNWGPQCVGPQTAKNAACSAIPGAPKPIVDAYPAAMQTDPGFCAALEKLPNAKELLSPFVVVREKEGHLVPVPYTEAYAEPMRAIAGELRAAAAETEPKEQALRAYLDAAAQSFTTNDWEPADEAWSRMNTQNSRYYVRIGPDEVLSDPCSQKAQFHLDFARINADSLEWQQKLTAVEEEMERTLAQLIGPPYAARNVTFHLPDFIDIVFNGGDDRAPLGGTAGESLPNWGKIVTEGRGRTVAMSNLFADPDSLARSRAKAETVFDADAMKPYSDVGHPGLLSTILHEATHNLGPKGNDRAFGGKLASMLEELKAQTGGLYFIDWLRKKGALAPELADRSYIDSLVWAMRHISNGMHQGSDDPYAQLSAIQIGFLMDDGAIAFDPAKTAANGVDKGAFAVHFDRLPASIERLMKVVGTIKAKNDRAGAEELVRKYVDGTVVPQKTIGERQRRFPQSTLVYAIDR